MGLDAEYLNTAVKLENGYKTGGHATYTQRISKFGIWAKFCLLNLIL